MIFLRQFLFVACVAFLIPACSVFKRQSSSASSSNSTSSNAALRFRNNVADYGKQYVGTNYKYAGTSPQTGFDCSGFTSYVLKQFNVKVSPASSKQATEGLKIDLNRVLPGDLIFFSENGSKISHVAMVVKRSKDGITCVHSTTSRGVIVENITTSKYWEPKIMFARDVITGQVKRY